MSLFKDLINELQEEKLLEDRVEKDAAGNAHADRPLPLNPDGPKGDESENVIGESKSPADEGRRVVTKSVVQFKESLPTVDSETEVGTAGDTLLPLSGEPEKSGKDDYLNRVVESVKSLQYVQHIVSGIQRERLRESPELYDTVNVKLALHKFFSVYKDRNQPGPTPEESALISEMENWHSALMIADKKYHVGDLREYSISTKPSLTSEALVSMARFYRNSPFSEDIRSKFDYTVTRIFSREIGDERREMLFDRNELISHLTELYAEWSSVSVYENSSENPDLESSALKFEEFVDEVHRAQSFEELVNSGFFRRRKEFKSELQENFYSPLLVVASIESNINIGNRYADLIDAERIKADIQAINEEYTITDNQNARGKSAQLAKVLKERTAGFSEKGTLSHLRNNKWAFAILGGIIATVPMFLILRSSGSGENVNPPVSIADSEIIVDLEKSSFKTYIHSARIHNKTLFASITPAWKKLPLREKERILGRIQIAGTDRGYDKVQLTKSDGSSVGFASKNGVNLNK